MFKKGIYLNVIAALVLAGCVGKPIAQEVVSSTAIPTATSTFVPSSTPMQASTPTTLPTESGFLVDPDHCDFGLWWVLTYDFAEFFVYGITPDTCPPLELGGIHWVRDTFSNPNTELLQGTIEDTAFRELNSEIVIEYLSTFRGFLDPETDIKVMYESKNRKTLSLLLIVMKMEERQDSGGETDCPSGWYHSADDMVGSCCPIGFIYTGSGCELVDLPTQYCQDGMASQLIPYMLAEVNPDIPEGNLLRSNPGVEHSVQGGIMPGEVVKIVGGFECADGYTWWYVESRENELTGWTVEGDGLEYWLIPWMDLGP